METFGSIRAVGNACYVNRDGSGISKLLESVSLLVVVVVVVGLVLCNQ